MLQRRPNRTELISMDSYIQILCRFQKCKQKVPPLLLLSNENSPFTPTKEDFSNPFSSIYDKNLWVVCNTQPYSSCGNIKYLYIEIIRRLKEFSVTTNLQIFQKTEFCLLCCSRCTPRCYFKRLSNLLENSR